EVERLGDAGKHAKSQNIDLHQAQSVDIVLVPFDERAVFHRCIADRHGLVEPVLSEHEAPDMLREMARKPKKFVRQIYGAAHFHVLRIKPCLFDMLAWHRPLAALSAP